MKLNFLGTGNCAGVPVFGCGCRACTKSRTNSALRRHPTCGRITSSSQTILIDAGRPDLAEIMEYQHINRILLTHYHVDHVQGLFHIRWGRCEKMMPVHGPDDQAGCADLLKHHGILDFSETLSPFSARMFGDIEVTPLPLRHSKLSLGYALENQEKKIGWLCDTSGLPDETLNFLTRWSPDIMVIDCTFPPLSEPHPNHNNINTILELHDKIVPGRTFLTHISHDLDLWLAENENTLPESIDIARDGMII